MFATIKECADYYGNVMDEIRQRAGLIRKIAEPEGKANLSSFGASDLAVLQLRKMCEGVALGCLAAHSLKHRDYLARTMEHYRADLLIKSLDKQQLQGFPKPLGTTLMTRERLISIYHQSDSQMHVGRLPKREATAALFKCEEMASEADEIMSLLERHTIMLSDTERLRVEVPKWPIGKVTVHYEERR